MMNLARLVIQKPLLPYRCYHLTALSLAKIVENVPALGESITEGTIASWAKKVGDKVNADDVIVVIETDKVTVDVKAARSGVLTKQLAVDTVRLHPVDLAVNELKSRIIPLGAGWKAFVRD